jgi:hypothetical protein
MSRRDGAIILGWAATIGGLFFALTPGFALVGSGLLTLLLALFVMGGD